jgi:hypothetical protein
MWTATNLRLMLSAIGRQRSAIAAPLSAATLARIRATLRAPRDLKVIQAMLGHASVILAADTYTSVLPDLARTTAEAVAAQIMKATRTSPGLTLASPWPSRLLSMITSGA